MPTQDEQLDQLLSVLYNSGWVDGNEYADKVHDGRQPNEDAFLKREKDKVERAKSALQRMLVEARIDERAKTIQDVKKAGYGYDDGTGFVLKISFAELEQQLQPKQDKE
jgi:uncharacterized protein (UPF0303 family)